MEYGLQNGCLTVDSTVDPQNSYAISKDTLRRFLVQLQTKNNELALISALTEEESRRDRAKKSAEGLEKGPGKKDNGTRQQIQERHPVRF